MTLDTQRIANKLKSDQHDKLLQVAIVAAAGSDMKFVELSGNEINAGRQSLQDLEGLMAS